MVRLLYPALAAVVLHGALLWVYLGDFQHDPSALACVGEQHKDTYPYEHVRTFFKGPGYDGQFYYALARAPFAHYQRPEVDEPAKRQLRIFYPLVCWLLTGGHPVLLLGALPLVNLLAIGGLAWLGALLAWRQGFSPWWGMLLPLAVNAGLPALRDLTDAVSTCTLAAFLVVWLLRGPWWALTLCAAAAVFSREQNTAALAIVFACAAWRRQWLTCAGLAAVLVLWFGWVVWLWQTYQESPFLQAINFAQPFAGLHLALIELGDTAANRRRSILCLLLLAFQTLLALDLLRRRNADLALRLTGLFGVCLMLIGGAPIYGEVWSYSRVYANLPLAVWLGCVQTRRLWPLLPMSAYVIVQWTIAW